MGATLLKNSPRKGLIFGEYIYMRRSKHGITEGDMLKMIDFTPYQIDLTANYGGSDQKRGIIYQSERYMLKMPDRISDDKNSSYSNSVYSENVCCEIVKKLGFEVQDTLIGYIESPDGEQKPVVACKNFVPQGYSLVDFRAIEDAVLLDRKAGKIPRIEDIYSIMSGNNAYFSKEIGAIALERYWDTFILDAMLGNFDRHANNWAYFIKNDGSELKFAPIFDCGSCLYPHISDTAIPNVLSSESEIIMRIDKYPTATLELPNKMKANYREYIQSLSNPDCTAALLRVYPLIDVNKINEVISSNSSLSDIRKEFYRTMIHRRIERILEPAYEKAYKQTKLASHTKPYKKKSKGFEYGD